MSSVLTKPQMPVILQWQAPLLVSIENKGTVDIINYAITFPNIKVWRHRTKHQKYGAITLS